MLPKMENEAHEGADVQDSQESRRLRLQSSSTNVQIDLLRGLYTQLEQEGLLHPMNHIVYILTL